MRIVAGHTGRKQGERASSAPSSSPVKYLHDRHPYSRSLPTHILQ